jgi:DHA2 family multidrug resistance protein
VKTIEAGVGPDYKHLRPDHPLAQAPYLSAPFSLTDPSGTAALNHEVTRQAPMIAYNDDFAFLLIVILASLPYYC